ncbi:MAG: hypothetical protein KUF72_03675, partial [Candidatus Thiodiazotropha sp. (ex Ctena orbiculata)]|nr:hypothetical protein [Candidatus Thiodiazotropha taylori]
MSIFSQYCNSMSLGFRVLDVCFALLLSLPVLAGGGVDKSGVKPQVLKLPTGPGSIDGLGESFEAQINSGTASYSVPLAVPLGRAGFQPNITLNYNGGNGNSMLGIGWTISLPSIQRRTDNGLPVYDDKLDIFVAGGEELIEVSPDIYRVENEGIFQRFLRQGDNWLVQHRDGSTTYYNASSTGVVSDGNHIFRWYPSRRVDVNGNEILYHYNESTGFGNGQAPADGSAYLTSITYNENEIKTHQAKVTLHYQQRSSYDSLFSYRSRYPIQLTQRVGEIRTWVSGQPVRVYKLIYDPKSVLSRLGAVEIYGRDLSKGPLPSILRFEYSEFALNSMIMPMDQGINPGVGLFSPDVDLVDMNGDALPDLLHTGDVQRVYLNDDGKTWSHSYDVPGGFSTIKLQQSNTMLMDMDADGHSDLFQHFQQDAGSSIYRYFRGGQTTGGWEL